MLPGSIDQISRHHANFLTTIRVCLPRCQDYGDSALNRPGGHRPSIGAPTHGPPLRSQAVKPRYPPIQPESNLSTNAKLVEENVAVREAAVGLRDRSPDERSEIRDRPRGENPAFRFAPCGLRLLVNLTVRKHAVSIDGELLGLPCSTAVFVGFCIAFAQCRCPCRARVRLHFFCETRRTDDGKNNCERSGIFC